MKNPLVLQLRWLQDAELTTEGYPIIIKTRQVKLQQKPFDMKSEGFFVPENAVPKVRVELTQGHPYRFLSLMRIVLIGAIRRVLVQPLEYSPQNVRA